MPQWERLLHAYGRAVDTPAHLRALEGSNPEAAFDHLWSAVLHQGSIYTATGPVVACLCEALREGRLSDPSAAVSFIAEAFRSANEIDELEAPPAERRARLDRAVAAYDEDTFWGDDELVNDLMVTAVLDLRAVAPLAVAVARERLDRADPELVDLYVQATRAGGGSAAEAGDVLRRFAAEGSDRMRATAILGLGELGIDTAAYLADDALPVRAAAALAGSGPQALAVLRDAAMSPRELDAELTPAQFDMRARFYVIRALCERATDFDWLLPAALACVPVASPHTVDHDWGVFLKKAPQDMTEAKRTYLAALVERADLWDPQNGNAHLVFKDAGLPYDRAACARLAGRPSAGEHA